MRGSEAIHTSHPRAVSFSFVRSQKKPPTFVPDEYGKSSKHSPGSDKAGGERAHVQPAKRHPGPAACGRWGGARTH